VPQFVRYRNTETISRKEKNEMRKRIQKQKPVKVNVRPAEGVHRRVIHDDVGNEIHTHRFNSEIRLLLKLKTETHTRKVGIISPALKTITCERTLEKHLHILSDSYGFNYHILSNAKLFNAVVLIEKEEWTGLVKIYNIKVADILNSGSFLHFNNAGFEKQIFITREWMKSRLIKIH